jgi:Resolvase, N terminal domain
MVCTDMCSQKHYYTQPLQVLIEPGLGSLAVGYVRTSSARDDSINLDLQRRWITEFAESKGWKLARWYEEPEEYEGAEQRPVIAQLLSDASSQFQVVLCSASRYWSRNVDRAYESLDHLRQRGIWWATADGQWNINTVWQKGIDELCILARSHRTNSRRARSQTWRKEEN